MGRHPKPADSPTAPRLTPMRWRELLSGAIPTEDETNYTLCWMFGFQSIPRLTYRVVDLGILERNHDTFVGGTAIFSGTCHVQCSGCRNIYPQLSNNVRARGFTCPNCLNQYKLYQHGTSRRYNGVKNRRDPSLWDIEPCRCDECKEFARVVRQENRVKNRVKNRELRGKLARRTMELMLEEMKKKT